MSDVSSVSDRIVALLRENLFVEPAGPGTDLVEAGMIDSAGFAELFALLEDEFGIEVRSDDLRIDNFRSVERMASFVLDKRGSEARQS